MIILTSVLWILLLTMVKGQFVKDLTLHSIWGRLELNKSSIIQCSSESNYDKIQFSRPHHTVYYRDLPKSHQIFWRGNPFFDSLLIIPDSNDSSRIGPYQCGITIKSETEVVTTEVVTIKLPPSNLADLEAVTPYIALNSFAHSYTLEVNVRRTFPAPIKWSINGREIKDWTGLTKVVVNGYIREGLYECYYEGRHYLRVHAIMRVVVRSAQDESENPPCYNGGVYNYKYGVCICPPGFTGDRCERACGPNKFGTDCDKLCSLPQTNKDTEQLCAGHVFCKPYPYGCSCAAGFRGRDCMESCEVGWYGADCKEQCHCVKGEDSCNRFTGSCEGGCLAGWSGESCHIRACPLHRYGLYCENVCECQNGAKCAEDGKCFCMGKWEGRFCNEMAAHIIYDGRIDATLGQFFNLTCTAEGNPAPWVEIKEEHKNNFEEKNPYQPWMNFSQVVVELKPNTVGFYRFVCSAKNSHGLVYEKLELSVNYSP